jgi:hypothetical protein
MWLYLRSEKQWQQYDYTNGRLSERCSGYHGQECALCHNSPGQHPQGYWVSARMNALPAASCAPTPVLAAMK